MKYDREKMEHWMLGWRQSGQSLTVFCRAPQLSNASFYYWRSKLESKGIKRSSSFLSGVACPGSFPLATLHYSNGVRLDVFVPLDTELIKPLMLGRKNYLFAGSHQVARRNAMFYSFFACCQARDINSMEWLINTMDRIGDTKMNDLAKLLT